MVITCPHCNLCRDIGDVRIPATGATATCPGCQRQFEVQPEQQSAAERLSIEKCPACGFTAADLNSTEICPQCGVVFSKYLARLYNPADSPDLSRNETFMLPVKESVFKKLLCSKYFLLAAMILAMVAGWFCYGYDRKLNPDYRLQPGTWQGELTYLNKKHPFVMVIETVDNGQLTGNMEWVGYMPRYRLAIRGTHIGNHLQFEDYKFLEGDSKYGLHDKKDVYVQENELNGTDKNGRATLHAVRLASEPDPLRELQKY